MFKKILFSFLFLFLPMSAFAAGSVEDLVVELPDNFSVSAGEKFSIPVVAAYDKTEECTEFLYDWRQKEGTKVTPLNDNVMNPEFEINTPGTYVFTLTIEARCGIEDEDVEGIVSEPGEVTVLVEGTIPSEEIEWEKMIQPEEITLEADGMSKHIFNLFLLQKHNGAVDYPSNERVEFLLRTDDPILQSKTGKIILSSDRVQEGVLTVTYFAPYVPNEEFEGGVITLQAAMPQGTVESKINLTPAETTYSPKLEIYQIMQDPPFLIRSKQALGVISLDWVHDEESATAEVEIKQNGEIVEADSKNFYRTYTNEQQDDNEHLFIFAFDPSDEEEDKLEVYLKIDGEEFLLEKKYRNMNAKDLVLPLYALQEGEWSEKETLDIEATFSSQVDFLAKLVPANDILLETGDLNNVPVLSRGDMPGNAIILIPEEFENVLPSGETVLINGNKTDLARAYFSKLGDFSNKNTSKGVLTLKNNFEFFSSEDASIFKDPINGIGIPHNAYEMSLIKLLEDQDYPDLDSSHWADEYLKKLIKTGVMKGYSDGTVQPNKEVSRAEFLKMLLVAGNANVSGYQKNTYFEDVQTEDWFSPYVEFAVRKRVVRGYADGTFKPHNSVSRAEAVKILSVYAGLNVPIEIQTTNFVDVKPTDWFAPYVQAAYESEIVSGYSDGTFLPAQSITRAEAAKIIAEIFFK